MEKAGSSGGKYYPIRIGYEDQGRVGREGSETYRTGGMVEGKKYKLELLRNARARALAGEGANKVLAGLRGPDL